MLSFEGKFNSNHYSAEDVLDAVHKNYQYDNWLLLGEQSMQKSLRSFESATHSDSLLWSQAAVQVYQRLQENCESKSGKLSFKKTEMRERIRAISRFGQDCRNDLLSMKVVETWLLSYLKISDLKVFESKEFSWDGFPMDRIVELHNVKLVLSVVELCFNLKLEFSDIEYFRRFLNVRTKLP